MLTAICSMMVLTHTAKGDNLRAAGPGDGPTFNSIPAVPRVIQIRAIHQPRETLGAIAGHIPKHLAVYEILACGEPVELAMSQVRAALAESGLLLVAPGLVAETLERERSRGRWAWLAAVPDHAAGAAIGLAIGSRAEAAIAAGIVSAVGASLRRRVLPREIAPPIATALTARPECGAVLALAMWPGPETVGAKVLVIPPK